MVYIGDVVNAISLAVNRLDAMTYGKGASHGNVEVFNIGTDSSTSAIELIRKILWLTNSSSPLQTLPGDARFPDRYVGDTSRAAEVLGFRAEVGIDEGLHRLVTAYMTETKEYLVAKRDSLGCDVRKHYSIDDLVDLMGCSGTLAADVDGQPFYAFFEEGKEGRADHWGWRDEDEPQPWDFEIEKLTVDTARLRLTRMTEDGKTIPFEVPVEGLVLERHTHFVARIQPSTGYISLKVEATGAPVKPWEALPPPGRRDLIDGHSPEASLAPPRFRFRITPFCCAKQKAPWPFFREDPLASAILDDRLQKQRSFNASQIATLCSRLSEAYDLAQSRLERFKSDKRPIKLQQADLPTGRPADWRVRQLEVCTNLCDHPTVCVDTGSCACGQPSCVPRLRFPFAAYANLPGLSYPPPTIDWESITANDPAALVAQVEKASWLNVLRPAARRYLSRSPAFPDVAVARCPDDVEREKEQDPDKFQRLQTEWHGCFSADNVMERGAKAIATEKFVDGSMVFLPYYAYNGGLRVSASSCCDLQ